MLSFLDTKKDGINSLQTVNKDVESVYITTEKISKKFDVISGVEIDKINNERRDELDG